MVPKKPKTLLKETAEVTGNNLQLVEDITSFFWEDTRKALVELRSHNIYIESFGTFVVKGWKLPEVETKLCQTIAYYNELQESKKMTFQRFSILKDLQARLDKIKAVKEMIAKDQVKKQQVKDKRDATKSLEK